VFGQGHHTTSGPTVPADEQRVREDVTRELAHASDPAAFQALAAERFQGLAACTGAMFFAVTADASRFDGAGLSGATAVPSPPTFEARGALAKWLRVNGETLVLADRPEVVDYLPADERDRLRSLAAVACVPLALADRLVAFIVLSTVDPQWRATSALVARLDACGRQAAMVAESVAVHYHERLRLEAASRAQQLAVAGQLAAAVAHEVRNPLTTIRSSVQFVLESPTAWTNKTELLRQVMSEVDRINRSISGVLGLNRPQALALADLDLAELVEASLALFQPYFNHHCLTLDRRHDDGPLPVRGDPGQLRQVLLNVLLNACQATPDGGRLAVRFGRTTGPGGAPAAAVQIVDSGPGIPADHLARIFEPFFTTKVNGTGLGLSICLDIMSRHHGSIRLDSQVGDGTTVHLTLPLREG